MSFRRWALVAEIVIASWLLAGSVSAAFYQPSPTLDTGPAQVAA